jgi:hypothetical protein
MKVMGGVLVVLYAALSFSGYEPFAQRERNTLPAHLRGPGLRSWSGGYLGGK